MELKLVLLPKLAVVEVTPPALSIFPIYPKETILEILAVPEETAVFVEFVNEIPMLEEKVVEAKEMMLELLACVPVCYLEKSARVQVLLARADPVLLARVVDTGT